MPNSPPSKCFYRQFHPLWCGVVLFFLGVVEVPLWGQTDVTVEIPYKGKSYVGKPLAWDGKELVLLRRNGKISYLPVASEHDYQHINNTFQPWPQDVFRQRLQQEFGRKYQVSLTRNFVVVHPPGDYQVWAMPFEKLYQRFTAYFKSRHFSLSQPEFPMVAVVLRSRREFDKFLKAFHTYDEKILGYYSPRSNRIITYDQTGGAARSQNWFFNAHTIIHEATHQTAFNTGIHSRYVPIPRWVSEGLAQLFEAPGINNSMHYTRLSDRVNHNRLKQLKEYYRKGQVKPCIAELITSDNLFRTDPSRAYAVSWGMTFYLSEKMPKAYHQFLRDDAKRKDFSGHSSAQRASAFAASFGPQIDELSARMEQFIATLD